MMRDYIKYWFIGGGLWGAVGLSACALAGGVNDVLADWEHTQQAVHELMHQETEKLLQQRRQRSFERSQSASEQGAQLSSAQTTEQCLFDCLHDTELLSLYGVGTDVYVQLRHDGQTYLFVPGQHQPLGHVDDSIELTLDQISGRCVKLQIAEKEIQQCLLPVQH
ncbi:MAG TPA: hypothetical protein VK082_01120 [Paenalcaligenes sp.]|nr:hypothetical protein [Paenalcaligenes sp.]